LLTARVNGCSRDPEPPARMIPFSIAALDSHEDTKTRSLIGFLRAFASSWRA
jgi:hypothetical protein